MTLFLVCLVASYRPSGIKLYAYSTENPLISIENVYRCCDLVRGQTDLIDVSWVVLQQYILNQDKNLLNPKIIVCATYKTFKCKTCYYQGQGHIYDMQLKLLSFICALGMNIKSLS